jgi:hypothetical protein
MKKPATKINKGFAGFNYWPWQQNGNIIPVFRDFYLIWSHFLEN